jgi:cobalt-zinc-cadmium efflux system membrane fusion protein
MPQLKPISVHNFSLYLITGLLTCCLLSCVSDKKEIQSLTTEEALQNERDKNSMTVSLDESQQKEIGLQVTEVRRGLVKKTVESPGQVQPNSELSTLVSTPSAGRVAEVKARLGDSVKAGQVMAIIKSDPIGQVQSDLLQNVLQTKADIKQQEVGLKLDHTTFGRESILYKEQVSAQADLQTAENQLEKDEANLAALQAKLAAYIKVAQQRLNMFGAPPDSARRVIDQNKIDPYVIVRAPRAGIVIERTINPGELTDGTKELFTLTDLSQVWLVANVFEKDVELVKKGQEASVTIDSIVDHSFPAQIVWVGDSINSTTRTLPVRANVANPDYILRPNMFARIKIDAGNTAVTLVPRSAIIQKGDRTLAFVETAKGVYEERDVKTGLTDANDIEIVKGLNLGERVVSQGSTGLLGTAMKTAEGRSE